MALQFEFRKDKIVLDAKFFMFKEFSAIWKHDKTKDKLKANQILFFIYLLCDIGQENPLKDVAAEKKEVEAKFRAFGDKSKQFTTKERELLEKAVKVYITINTTPRSVQIH